MFEKNSLEVISALVEQAEFRNTIIDVCRFLGADVGGLSVAAQKKIKKSGIFNFDDPKPTDPEWYRTGWEKLKEKKK